MPAINNPVGDFVTTSLSGVVAAAATTATIGTGLNLPATNGVLQISYDTANAIGATDGPETVTYATYTTGTGALTGLTRGCAGTTDVQHSSGQSVQAGPSIYHLTGELGYTEITSNFATTTTPADVDVTNLTTTVTVPSGGRKVKVIVYSYCVKTSGTGALNISIKEGSTVLQQSYNDTGNAKYLPITMVWTATPTAGAHTYKVTVSQSSAGTITFAASATSPAFILCELI